MPPVKEDELPMDTNAGALARHAWLGTMTLVGIIGTLLLACATPFPALAAIAGLHVGRREGTMLIALAWAASQITGFCVMGYEPSAQNMVWGAVLLAAGMAALPAARFAGRAAGASPVVRLAAAYLAAFVAFKLVVLAGVVASNAGWDAFSAEILFRQFVRYGLFTAVFGLVHAALVRAGWHRSNRAFELKV